MKSRHHQVIGVLFFAALFVGLPLILVVTVSSPQTPPNLLIFRTVVVSPLLSLFSVFILPDLYRWVTGKWGWRIPNIPQLPDIPPFPPPEFNPSGVPRQPTGPPPLIAYAVPEVEEDGKQEVVVRF